MIQRRLFLKQCAGVATAALLAGCGGSGDGGESGQVIIDDPLPAPTPTPVPAPAPTPAPAAPPTGDAPIDREEADIAAGFDGMFAGFGAGDAFHETRVAASADEFAAIFLAMRSNTDAAGVLGRRTRIVCDWDGVSTLASGAANRLYVNGIQQRTDGHLDHGGGILVVPGNGRRPAFGNQIEIAGARGIHFDRIDFFRQRVGTEVADTSYGANICSNSTFPAKPVVLFTGCRFGARHIQPNLPQSQWVCALNSVNAPHYVGLFGCSFNGHPTIAKLAVRRLRVDRCDFQSNLRDVFSAFGHLADSDYHAHIWISRCTFRGAADGWENRNEHMDVLQTGHHGDVHLGYRCLLTDLVVHHNHSFAGDPGMGGGTQGFFNNGPAALGIANQFVIRRCIVLVASPNGFAFYSPTANRPSYVDQCTFMRCGSVPSGFAGDSNPQQDFAIGVTSQSTPGGPWLFVTRSYGMDMRVNRDATVEMSMAIVDPRGNGRAADGTAPERIFRGRDFTRGGAAANHVAGKFGYRLPRETDSQARFAEDIWANFEPVGGYAGIGSPDPRAIWAG